MFPGFGKDKKVGQLVDRRCLFLGFFGLLYPGAVETHGDAGLGTGWLLLLSHLSQNDCHLSASHPRPANGPIRPLSSLPPRNPRPSHHHRLNSQLWEMDRISSRLSQPAFHPLLLMGFFRPFLVVAAWLPLPVTIACIWHCEISAMDDLKAPFDTSRHLGKKNRHCRLDECVPGS